MAALPLPRRDRRPGADVPVLVLRTPPPPPPPLTIACPWGICHAQFRCGRRTIDSATVVLIGTPSWTMMMLRLLMLREVDRRVGPKPRAGSLVTHAHGWARSRWTMGGGRVHTHGHTWRWWCGVGLPCGATRATGCETTPLSRCFVARVRCPTILWTRPPWSSDNTHTLYCDASY